ncbi:MAG: phosphotransferase family protein [Chloroflexota bacterium]
MEKGEIIGRGARAVVYALPDGKALKLYQPTTDPAFLRQVEYEAWLGRAVWEAGVAAPRVYSTVIEDGAPGIVYERIDGREMLREMLDQPHCLRTCATQMADLHADIHTRTIPGLPRALAGLKESVARVALPPAFAELGDIRAAALRALDALADGDRLCHGDFHPMNIMMSSRGLVTIDWTGACLCAPVADVARTVLLLKMLPAFIPGDIVPPDVAERSMRDFLDAYLTRYDQRCSLDWAALAAWELPLAVARIAEDLPQEWPRLRELIAARLS